VNDLKWIWDKLV